VLNDLGKLVQDEWRKTPELRPQVELDEFVVMPNHFHAIVWLNSTDDASAPPPTLGRVIAGFKSAVARYAKRDLGVGEIWHRNYFERVIRNDRELLAIRRYIVDNPAAWAIDRLNPTDDDADDEPWMQ
jgi:REP element-mobilizing transposase RayT